ncbi:hypothetical protein K6025_02985 [Ehrlichia sp. JZT12]
MKKLEDVRLTFTTDILNPADQFIIDHTVYFLEDLSSFFVFLYCLIFVSNKIEAYPITKSEDNIFNIEALINIC